MRDPRRVNVLLTRPLTCTLDPMHNGKRGVRVDPRRRPAWSCRLWQWSYAEFRGWWTRSVQKLEVEEHAAMLVPLRAGGHVETLVVLGS